MAAVRPLFMDVKGFGSPLVVQQQNKRARRNAPAVSFAPQTLLYEIPHTSDNNSDEERRHIWWREDDLAVIRLKCLITVQKIEELGKEFKETERKSARGLEHFTRQGNEIRRKRRRLAADAVLQEQVRQWSRDIQDPELIAKSYQEVSLVCQRDARSAAMRDENKVKEEVSEAHSKPIIRSHSSGITPA